MTKRSTRHLTFLAAGHETIRGSLREQYPYIYLSHWHRCVELILTGASNQQREVSMDMHYIVKQGIYFFDLIVIYVCDEHTLHYLFCLAGLGIPATLVDDPLLCPLLPHPPSLCARKESSCRTRGSKKGSLGTMWCFPLTLLRFDPK